MSLLELSFVFRIIIIIIIIITNTKCDVRVSGTPFCLRNFSSGLVKDLFWGPCFSMSLLMARDAISYSMHLRFACHYISGRLQFTKIWHKFCTGWCTANCMNLDVSKTKLSHIPYNPYRLYWRSGSISGFYTSLPSCHLHIFPMY
jgi:hypothetical protein